MEFGLALARPMFWKFGVGSTVGEAWGLGSSAVWRCDASSVWAGDLDPAFYACRWYSRSGALLLPIHVGAALPRLRPDPERRPSSARTPGPIDRLPPLRPAHLSADGRAGPGGAGSPALARGCAARIGRATVGIGNGFLGRRGQSDYFRAGSVFLGLARTCRVSYGMVVIVPFTRVGPRMPGSDLRER